MFITLAVGALPAAAFRIGATASEADDRIVYDSVTGALIYDSDGAVAGGSIQLATLSAGPALSSGDFLIV